MEVKSIFVNTIMRSYEQSVRPGAARKDPDDTHDTVNISSRAGQRLFGEMMEHSLTKSLNKDHHHEGD